MALDIAFAVLFLATLVEGLVEYLFPQPAMQPYLKYIALVLGVAAAIAYKIDIPSIAGLTLTGTSLYVSYVISGIIIGRGSNYANDIISLVRAKTVPAQSPVYVMPSASVAPASAVFPG